MPNANAAAQAQPRRYLASQSPRRRMMMRWLGIPVALTRADIDETPQPGEPPADLAVRLARQKAEAAARTIAQGREAPGAPHQGCKHHSLQGRTNGWVLAADTVVDLDGVSLDKPADATAARATLQRLRGRAHQVHTGLALALIDPESSATGVSLRRVTTHVTMRPYTDAEIDAYIATGDPMDKAGAYAIQHAGFAPVARVDICYANVVGLPLCAVVALLQDAGESLTAHLPDRCPAQATDNEAPHCAPLCAAHFAYRCDRPDTGEVIQ